MFDKPIKTFSLLKSEYDRLLRFCQGSIFTVDEFIAHKFLEKNPSDVKVFQLFVRIIDPQGRQHGTLTIDIGNEQKRSKLFPYRGYKIHFETYGFKDCVTTLVEPSKKYQLPLIRYRAEGAGNWTFSEDGFTKLSYALKFAKEAIDNHIENSEWMGSFSYKDYHYEVFSHTIKGFKYPFYAFKINNWDGNEDDSQQFGYKKAIIAFDAAERTINHHFQYLDENQVEDSDIVTTPSSLIKHLNRCLKPSENFDDILSDATAIVDYAVNQKPSETSTDNFWDTKEESPVEQDDFWADVEDPDGFQL